MKNILFTIISAVISATISVWLLKQADVSYGISQFKYISSAVVYLQEHGISVKLFAAIVFFVVYIITDVHIAIARILLQALGWGIFITIVAVVVVLLYKFCVWVYMMC